MKSSQSATPSESQPRAEIATPDQEDVVVAAPAKDAIEGSMDGAAETEVHKQPPRRQAIDAQALTDEHGDDPPESLLFRAIFAVASALEWLFGAVSLIVGLAVLATIPILQILSLGYLLEVPGRIARTGRFASGFVGVRKAARVGGIVLGTWLCLVPLGWASSAWYASNLIDPASPITAEWRTGQLILTILLVGHILAAWYCGGRLRHFFWPIIAPLSLVMWLLQWLASTRWVRPAFDWTIGLVSPRLVRDICNWRPLTDWLLPAVLLKAVISGRMYVRARDAVWEFVEGLHLPHFFWLGLRGFAGAVVWLAVPTMFLIGSHLLATGQPGVQGVLAVFCGLIGIVLLTIVVFYLPFVLAQFSADNRFGAMFEVGRVRALFNRSPIAFGCAMVLTLALALPLYLLKIEATPQELTWIPSVAFVMLIFPGKLATGWAVGRGRKRLDRPPGFTWPWLMRVAMVPVVLAYALFVAVTPFAAWFGVWSLLEHHAFLVPAPFLGF